MGENMATLRELIIKISANSQSFQSEISRASRMGNDYYRVMQTGGRQSAAASRETQRALAEVTSQINTAKASALGMAGAFAGAFATGHLISLADEWSSVNARLKQASQSSDDFTESQRALMDISQRTGTAFSDNASLFARSAASMREYGYSSEEVLKVTEAISTGLKLSGASASEASSVITQFSQALAQGVLRGEEFNSVNENGDRVIRALAAGMGVARKDLKAMADQGMLTADKVVPALISQLGTMRGEFEAMPQTVSAATTKVENAFMAWVGGANEATGATSTLVAVLNTVSDNIDTVATAAGALAAIGGARYLGGMFGDLGNQTAQLIDARKNEIALAAARAESATQSQRKAAADAIAAERAYQLSLSELELAKNTNAEATATQNSIAKRRAMIAANATLVQSNKAVSASQEALNRSTSVMNLFKSGATVLLSLVGGLPGILMLGAGAWYTMYQRQEQARESAIQYADTIEQVRDNLKSMSQTQISANLGQANISLDAQNSAIEQQKQKVAELSNQLYNAKLAANSASEGTWLYNDAVEKAADFASELAVEEGRLEQMLNKRKQTQQLINDITDQAINKTVEMAGAVSSLTEMYDRLNKVSRQSTAVSPPKYAGPVLPALDNKQQQAIDKAQRQLELSGLKGLDKTRKQAEFDASDLNLPAGWREKYVSMEVESARQLQAIRNSSRHKGGKSEAEKTADTYDKLIKQQKEQIALQGQNTELAKTKYQVTQGELVVLSEAQKTELLRNSAALDHLNAVERLKSLNKELLEPEEALLNTTRERIKLLREAAPATEEYRKTMERISKASVQEAPKFGGIDSSVGGASGELIRVADAQKELEKWHETQLEMQKELLDQKEINEQTYADRVAEINKTNASQLQDIQAGYTSASLAMFSDLAGQSAQLLQSIGQEGSLAYKTLFIASKAAAMAQAVINTELAATKAMAEGGLIMGIPAATAIRAVGYASVALIAGQSLAGMAHDGIDRVPETGTWLLQKGERVVTASTSAKLDATLERVQQARQASAGGTFHIQNNFTGKPDDATMAAIDQRDRRLVASIRKEMAAQVIKPDNDFGRALQSIYPNRRRG